MWSISLLLAGGDRITQGVVSMTSNEQDKKLFYTADDVCKILGVSKPTAYREIKKLNDELRRKGYITISGKVPRKYFEERLYC